MPETQNCILVVDDDKRMRKAVMDFLATGGYRMLAAGDGEEAWDSFQKNKESIELILLDIMMPGKDGMAVLRKIRMESEIPVILLTAKDRETDQITGFRQGADDYITKPFSPALLEARVESVLKRTKRESGRGIIKEGRL
ncbi:MAG: response regulator [Lachnospiraceae bacterium]|nr:response regulator [Lachnospiraceae bacterium]